MPNSLTLKLFDPGMTHLHRVGLAGLYMTLNQLDPAEYQEHGGWKLTSTAVELFWQNSPKDLLEPIIKKALGISKDGVLDFFVHRKHRMGDLEKFNFHKAVLGTFLQQTRTRKTAKEETRLSFEYDQKTITVSFKKLTQYNNQKTTNIFDKKGGFKKNIKLAGWAFPGGIVRHADFKAPTELSDSADKFLCLLFAPVGALFFLISCKNKEGKRDNRKGAAIILPHIKDLEVFDRCYRKYLHSPVSKLYANSLGDAGLSALAVLNAKGGDGMLRELEIDSCSIVTQGKVPWNKQGKSRTALEQIRTVNRPRLAFFSFASGILANKLVIKEDESYYVQTSTARGLIAGNIAADRPWYTDFYTIMQSQKIAYATGFDRRGLHAMIESERTNWPDPADKLFVETIHAAIRNRYGALAARASAKGEKIRFDREFEKIRTSLMRAKNAQTMRRELADLFARGGINKSLQQNWPQLLELFTGKDWQKARDLSLLALASYAGKGADEAKTDNVKENEE